VVFQYNHISLGS